MIPLRFRRPAQITLLATILAAGVCCERYVLTYIPVVVIGVCCIGSIVIFGIRLGLLLVLSFWLGFVRASGTEFTQSDLGRNLGQKVIVDGTISDDPGINEKQQAEFQLHILAINGHKASGLLRVYTATYQELQRGYRVQVTGKIKRGKGPVPAYMSYALLQTTSRHQNILERLRQRFFVAVRNVVSEPMSGLGIGLLIGARGLLDTNLTDTLRVAGLSHITAVSGANLTIIIQALRRLPLRLSHFGITAMSGWFIASFLCIAGLSASIVRAALVTGLGLLIRYYGYEPAPMTLIALPAYFTIVVKPDYLLSDVGWQLSFLAFFGILIIAPAITRRLSSRPNAITELVTGSIAAQVMTTPLIMWIFSDLSFVAPLANLLVVPMIPLAMLLSAIVGLTALLVPSVAAWLSLPLSGILALMIGLSQWCASLPHASEKIHLAGGWAIATYVFVIAITLVIRHKQAHLVKNIIAKR